METKKTASSANTSNVNVNNNNNASTASSPLPPPPPPTFKKSSSLTMPKPPPFVSPSHYDDANYDGNVNHKYSTSSKHPNEKSKKDKNSDTMPKLSSNLMPLLAKSKTTGSADMNAVRANGTYNNSQQQYSPRNHYPPQQQQGFEHNLMVLPSESDDHSTTIILPSPPLVAPTVVVAPAPTVAKEEPLEQEFTLPSPPPATGTTTQISSTNTIQKDKSLPPAPIPTPLSSSSSSSRPPQDDTNYDLQQKEEEESMKIPHRAKRNNSSMIHPQYYHLNHASHLRQYRQQQQDKTSSLSSLPSLKHVMLTSVQQSIPILIVSTNTAQDLIQIKNQITISELFTCIANSIGNNNNNNTNTFTTTTAAAVGTTTTTTTTTNTSTTTTTGTSQPPPLPSSTTTTTTKNPPSHQESIHNTGIRLPPLRTINGKSIQLKWDDLQFQFYNGSELDYGIGSSGNNTNSNNKREENDYLKRNEQMLHCASREDWSFLDSFTGASSGTGGINDTLKSKGLTVEQIEHHIESLIRNSDHHHDNNHDSNHKSPISNEYKSWTELHENNEPIQEDPIATQQQDFASEAHESLLAHVNDSSWLLRYRHVLNNITSSSCTTTTPTTTTSSCSSNSSSNRNDEYDSSSQKIPYYDTMLSCPAIILYVASSSDEYPIEALMEMNNSNIHLPNVCKNGFYDVNAMKRYYLVLHDEIDGSDSFDEEKIAQEMNFRFGNVGGGKTFVVAYKYHIMILLDVVSLQPIPYFLPPPSKWFD